MANRPSWTTRNWMTMVASAAVVVAVAALIAGAIALTDGGTTSSAVTLEPAAQTGRDPFTATVAVGPGVTFRDSVASVVATTRNSFPTDPKTHTLIAAATTPGLYGGSGDARVCDPEKVVSFLGQNPQKAAAWAGVLGISVNQIAAYVGGMTPVLLTSDTLVTNHGYRDGRATALQSVLQAGTAVMVDNTGLPRVKCNCGNPLSPPETITAIHTRGTPWPGYTPTRVTVVQPGPMTTSISVINIRTGAIYQESVGSGGHGASSGASAGEFVATSIGVAGYQGAYSTSPDATRWTVAARLKRPISGGLTWVNDKWLTFSNLGGSTQVLESTDLVNWNAIATVPAYLSDMAYGGGRLVAVGEQADADIGHGVVYTSTDGSAWTPAATTGLGLELNAVAYGNGTWIAVDNGHQGGLASMTYGSTDGTHWSRQSDIGLAHQGGSQLAFASGQWVLGGLVADPYATTTPDGAVSVSTDGNRWTTVSGTGFAHDPVTGVAFGDGAWVLVTQTGVVYSSSDARAWTKRSDVNGGAYDLSFGGGASAVASASTTTPTTAAATITTATVPPVASLSRVDWKNSTYDDESCPTPGPVKFTDGVWFQPGTQGTVSECSMSFVAVDYADVTGDGVPDAIVSLHGSASPVLQGQSDWTTVFTASPRGPVNHGYLSGPSFPPYSPTGITVWIPHGAATDADCCPSQYAKDAYAYSSGSGLFVKSGTTYVPASELPKR